MFVGILWGTPRGRGPVGNLWGRRHAAQRASRAAGSACAIATSCHAGQDLAAVRTSALTVVPADHWCYLGPPAGTRWPMPDMPTGERQPGRATAFPRSANHWPADTRPAAGDTGLRRLAHPQQRVTTPTMSRTAARAERRILHGGLLADSGIQAGRLYVLRAWPLHGSSLPSSFYVAAADSDLELPGGRRGFG